MSEGCGDDWELRARKLVAIKRVFYFAGRGALRVFRHVLVRSTRGASDAGRVRLLYLMQLCVRRLTGLTAAARIKILRVDVLSHTA